MKKLFLLLALLFALPAEAQTNQARMLSGINYQTGTTYTLVKADVTKVVVFSNGSPVSVALPAATTSGFGAGTIFTVKNLGPATVTINAVSGTINGSGSIAIAAGEGGDIYSDGTNFVFQGGAASTPPQGFPRLDQVTDQNQDKTFNQGAAALSFTGGALDLSGETSLTVPLIAGCTPTSNGQLCFDSIGLNYHGYNGVNSIIPAFDPTGVTSGDMAGFLLSGGKWTLTDLGPPGGTTGNTVVTATLTDVHDGDSLCFDSTAVPPDPPWVNCTPGVPVIVNSASTYTFDGSERGEAIFFTNAGANSATLPQASEATDFDASWFTFVKVDGGTLTITATTSTFFSTGTNTLTIGKGTACSLFSDPAGSGIYYDRCALVPLSAGSGVTLTPSAYSVLIAATGSGGTITGAGTANHSTKWTGAATIGDGSMLEDGTHAVRADVGFDVNQVGAYLWWAPNNTVTGTTVNKMACDDGTGKAIICPSASASTNSPVGVAVAANGATPGTSGSTGICIIGFCSVIFDNTATAGHYAQSSTTVAGDLTDVGTTIPTNGQSYWYIFTGNSGVGTAAIIRNLTPSELNASSISGGNGRNLQVQVNGTATTKTIKNLNATTPAADANNQLLTWKTSAASNTDSISVEVPLATTGQAGIVQLAGDLAGTSSAPTIAAQYKKLRCETGLGDGLNAMTAGTYLQFFCVNTSGVTWTITGINCWTDNAGSSTLNATNNAGTGLLTGAVTCNSTKSGGGAAGTQSGTTTLANNDAISFTFVADGTSKQTTWTVSLTQ